MNWWEQMIVTSFLGIVRGIVKNPKKAQGIEDTLVHIRDDVTQAVDALDANAPPPPGYKKA